MIQMLNNEILNDFIYFNFIQNLSLSNYFNLITKVCKNKDLQNNYGKNKL